MSFRMVLQRSVNDLRWVLRKKFLTFVLFWGVIQVGLIADGLLALLLAFSEQAIIPIGAWRFMVFSFPIAGGVWAAIMWLSVYWLTDGQGDSQQPPTRV